MLNNFNFIYKFKSSSKYFVKSLSESLKAFCLVICGMASERTEKVKN